MKTAILSAILAFLVLCCGNPLFAQVSINNDGSQPHPSAMLEVKSATKGFLPPSVALVSLDNPAPVTTPVAVGLLIYNTATAGVPPNHVVPGFYYWGGSQWIAVANPPGTNPGEMLFWNGSGWVTLPTGTHGQQLYFCNGVPSWGGCFAQVTCAPVTEITATAATCGGEVVSDGGTAVTARGVCWSTQPDPTILDAKTVSGSGTGPFVSRVTGLIPGTTYFIRAFATNTAGTAYAYGPVSTFTTMTLTDAPVTFLPDVTACPGDPIVVPVRVRDFAYIGSVALTLQYNPLALVFTGATNTSGFPGLFIDGLTPGTVLIDGTAGQAIALPDSAILFTMNFTYTGGESQLTWFDNGSSCEYRSADLTLLNDSPYAQFYHNGTVTSVPVVGVPVFTAGTESSRCQGAQSVSFPATAANAVSLSYSLDAASIAAGNTIDPATGTVVFISSWTGVSIINATADGCTGPKSAQHTVTTQPNESVSVSIAASGNFVCEGTAVEFTATVLNGGANPQYQWKVNGIPSGPDAPVFSYVPGNGDQVVCVVTSSAPCVAGNPATSNQITISVNPLLPVHVTITPSANSVCAGTLVSFTATLFNGGSSPVYEWLLNGAQSGGNGPSFNYIPTDGDQVACRVVSSAACVSNNPDTSNTVVMQVNPLMPVSVAVSASANTLCAGTAVTFQATGQNGGVTPIYQWFVNGLPSGTNQPEFSYTPSANDVVTCSLTSSENCAAGNPAVSTPLTMTVIPLHPVSVSIVSSANPVCEGTEVTFTATPVNGGASPVFQWFVNQLPAGTNSPVFSFIPTDNDTVACLLTSSEMCATSNPALSQGIGMEVEPLHPVSITITESANGVCEGTQVTFSAVVINGGANPSYQWRVNGSPAGQGGPEFSYFPVNGDVVTCSVNSTLGCSTGNPALSNPISMTVNPLLPVSVSIAASANPVCAGTVVTFLATPVNGGSLPQFQWFVNGVPAGENQSSYTYVPVQGDEITCRLTSDIACPSGNPALSNPVGMTVLPVENATIDITAGNNPVCAGTSVTFTAVYTHGGNTPHFQWTVNGLPVGADSPSLTYVPSDGDQVACSLTSDLTCLVQNPVVSNTIGMTVHPQLPVSVSINASFQHVCAGVLVEFTATPVNGGNNPVFEWRVNGIQTGTGQASFSYYPADNDQVTCLLVSDALCATGNPALSNVISMQVDPLLPVSLTITASANGVCAGTPVQFNATAVNPGNAPVYRWLVNGSVVYSGSSSFSYTPEDQDVVSCRLISNAPCATGSPALSNEITMSVFPLVPVSVTIAASANPVCAGTSVTYTATAVNPGSNPVYQWMVNGINTGINSPELTIIPQNNDQVTCVMTSGEACPAGNPAISNTIGMIVNPILPVSLSVSASSTDVCAGTEVTFTATATNGGTMPVFEWTINGMAAGSNSPLFSYVPLHNDGVVCTLTSDETCVSSNPASSIPVTMTVRPLMPVSVTISTTETTVCEGTSVTFTAVPQNGGSVPHYSWKVNGASAGPDDPQFTFVPQNGDVVTCELTSDIACPTGNPALSNPVPMTVNPLNVVSVTIQASSTEVCAGQMVTFTALAVNGGTSPVFQWKVNGIPAGSNSDTFTYGPSDQDAVTCTVISDIACPSGNPAQSNTIAVTVHPLLPVSVTVNASANTVCEGTSVTCTATAVNGGPNPQFEWRLNGLVTGTNSPLYSFIPVHNDIVTCILFSDANCPSDNPAYSDPVEFIVNPSEPVSVTITVSANDICAGTGVTFTATPVNGGTLPSYQWKVNGENVGSNLASYSYVPANGDIVGCILTSNAACPTGNPAVSNDIVMVVNPLNLVSVSIEASSTNVCAGESVTLTASAVNGGPSPVYQWKVNGVPAGINDPVFTFVPENQDAVTCTLTSTIGCPTGNPAVSNTTIITVQPLLPVSVSITVGSNPVCAGTSVNFIATAINGGTSPVYEWLVNGATAGTNNPVFQTIPSNGDVVTCRLTSDATCPSGNPAISNAITMTVNPLEPVSLVIAASANQVCAGTPVTFTATPENGGALPSYQWKINGLPVGASLPAYTYIPSDGDLVTCELTSNAVCPTGNPAISDTIEMEVNPLLPVSISVIASANPVCENTSVTFNAYPVNPGTTPSYQWKVNGMNVNEAINEIYTYVPQQGDVVTCVLTSGETCTTNNPATSAPITMTVMPLLPVSLTITATDNTVCEGTTVIFEAVPVNGGASPSFQWKLNGNDISGATLSLYSYIPSNNDQISCVLTSSEPCHTGNPALSNTLAMTVNPRLAVDVTIGATLLETCAGTTVTVTAVPVNGGINPVFVWKKNDIVVGGVTGPVYEFVPSNQDRVTCTLTSSEICTMTNPVVSNELSFTVHPLLPVSVNITASANPVCAGVVVNYYAAPYYGGTTPQFQWKVNGTDIPGATLATYAYSPVAGDQVTCLLVSSENCTTGNPALSNTITMTVNPLQPVSVSIVASANPVCYGVPVTFTATPVNPGPSPVFEWRVNGVLINGNSGPTYLYNPQNGDAIQCTLISNIGCASGNPAVSNTITMTVNPLLPVSATITASANPVCAGTSVTYTVSVVNGGTMPSYQWMKNGMPVAGATNLQYTYVPVNNDGITCVVTSNAVCATGNPATSNLVTMTVNPLLPVSVTIAPSANPVCAGTGVTFTSSVTNGGPGPLYQWTLNGSDVNGATNPSWSYVPQNGDVVRCRVTSNAVCATGNPALSDGTTLVVNPLLSVSVSITATQTTVCAGTQVTYTATPVNGGTTPVYQWKVNGTNVPGASLSTYTYAPAHNDQVSCQLTSNATCPVNNPANSNVIGMTVNPLLPVSITISASANPVCQGTTVTFTSSPVNGGSNPQYKWRVNGSDVQGATQSTYSYIPVNGDVVACVLTSNATCPTGNPATSNPITMTVNPELPVSLTITGLPDPVCAGTNVVYRAYPVNGGTNPQYQWNVNGNDIGGATSDTYTYPPNHNDIVKCELQSNATCATDNPAWSNEKSVVVNSLLPVSVTISESQNNVCSGTVVTFTASPVNGGSAPQYQWRVNGTPVPGATNVTYAYAPAHGDAVTCILTSNITCAFGNPATSNTVSMVVNPLLPVSVTIAESQNNVCAGTNVTFTATPVNGGTTPAYQWKVNGTNVPGATLATYAYVPLNGDQVTCVLTSSLTCKTDSPATSNTITMTVNTPPAASVTISVSANPVCAGTSVTFTAVPVNGGTTPAYQWFRNGTAVSGATVSTYAYVPVNLDTVYCRMTSGLSCVSGSPALSAEIGMTVNPTVTPDISITASANPSCAGAQVTYSSSITNGGSAPAYQWKVNGSNVTGATLSTYAYVPVNNDQIQCVLTSNANCVSPTTDASNIIAQTVNPATPVSSSITASVYAVMPSTSVTYTAAVVNGGSSPSYQWKVNNVNVGTNSSTYTYAPADHDKIVCVVSSSLSGCLSNNPATSNQVVAVVYTTGTPCSGVPTVTYGNKTYNTVQIGTQCWFRENLDIGTKITNTVNQTNNAVIEKYCYGNDDMNCNVYGGLYQWAEVVQYLNGATNTTDWNPAPTGPVQGICPSGWHVPTDTEWSTLKTYLGGVTQTGGKIKEATTAHFNAPNTSASNSSGFTALPSGKRWSSGSFYYINMDAEMWNASKVGTGTDAYYYGANYATSNALTGQYVKSVGLGVRCVKD